jgi:hypothetical protein
MLRIRFADGPRKGEIAEVSCEAGWAMLKDGRATDPRFDAPVAEVAATPANPEPKAVTTAKRGGRRS